MTAIDHTHPNSPRLKMLSLGLLKAALNERHDDPDLDVIRAEVGDCQQCMGRLLADNATALQTLVNSGHTLADLAGTWTTGLVATALSEAAAAGTEELT